MVEVKGSSARTFTVGGVARRAGVATSALRFYEANGLITGDRTDAGHRRYRADVMRRVGFIKVAQRVGLSLEEIRAALDSLPASRTPNRSRTRRSNSLPPRTTGRFLHPPPSSIASLADFRAKER
jgi:MerR family redox-sensitive transcriptional activator SoxR